MKAPYWTLAPSGPQTWKPRTATDQLSHISRTMSEYLANWIFYDNCLLASYEDYDLGCQGHGFKGRQHRPVNRRHLLGRTIGYTIPRLSLIMLRSAVSELQRILNVKHFRHSKECVNVNYCKDIVKICRLDGSLTDGTIRSWGRIFHR